MNPLASEELANPCVFRSATIVRIWEFPYVHVKGRDAHGPSDAIKQLAQAELERLIPERFRNRVKFISVEAGKKTVSDPLGQIGHYGWCSCPEA